MLIQSKNIPIIKPNLDQLKNFQQWKKANDEKFSLWDYLGNVADVEIAMPKARGATAFTTLFCPDLIEYEGGIFLVEGFDPDIYQQWYSQLKGDVKAIEKVMNHRHIDDLLKGSEQVGLENLYYLGQKMVQMWENRLKSVYPTRQFEVFCNQDEEDKTVIITFHQK